MSTAQIILVNAAIVAVVLATDVGRRAITARRLLRPLIAVAIVVPMFLGAIPTGSADVALQLAGLGTGVLLGLACHVFMRVERDPATGAAVSIAGVRYAALWIAIGAARLAFLYATRHGLGPDVGRFLATNHLSPAALANAFIGLSVAMAVTRTLVLRLRARGVSLPPAPLEVAAR